MTTIRDVAKLAGVSPSTASRVLHDSDMISEATKKKVRQAMKELDYSPNYLAQNLANKSNNMIYNDVFLKEFNNSDQAEEYFNELLEKVKNTNEAELKNLIISY